MENFIFCAVLAIGMIDVHESVKVRYYGSTSLGGVELVKVQMFIPNSDGWLQCKQEVSSKMFKEIQGGVLSITCLYW